MKIPAPIQQAIQAYYAECVTDEEIAALEEWFREDDAHLKVFAEHGMVEWQMLCEHEKQDAAAILTILREAEDNAEPDFSLLQASSFEIPAKKQENRPVTLRELWSLAGYVLTSRLNAKAALLGVATAILLAVLITSLPSKEVGTDEQGLADQSEPAPSGPLKSDRIIDPPSIKPVPEEEPRPPERRVVVASMVDGYRARWETEPREGLYAGQSLELKGGYAELLFTQGARVLVQGPAQIEPLSPTSVRIQSGRLYATTEDSDAIFEVYTPKLRLTDLGTSFGVLVDPGAGKTASYVYSGRVHAVPVDEQGRPYGEGVMLREAESVSVEAGSGIQLGGVDRYSFVTDTFDAQYTVQTQGQARYVGRLAVNADTAESLQSDRYCHLLLEQTGVLPPGPVDVTLVRPGLYEDFTALEESIRLQTEVDSYLVRFKTESGQLTTVTGRITFPRPIVGVILSTKQRMASDRLFSLPDSELGVQGGNGLEPYLERQKTNQIDDSDSIRLSDDRLTIDFQLAAKGMDQFRVLVQSEGGTPKP